MRAHFLPAISLPDTQKLYSLSITHFICAGMEYQYTGIVKTTPSASSMQGVRRPYDGTAKPDAICNKPLRRHKRLAERLVI